MSKEKNTAAYSTDNGVGMAVDENDLPPSTSEKERHKPVKLVPRDTKDPKSPQRKMSDPRPRGVSPKGSNPPAYSPKIVKLPDVWISVSPAPQPVCSSPTSNLQRRQSSHELMMRQKSMIPQNNQELINQSTSTKERASELRRKFSKCLINNEDRPYKPPKEYITESPKCKEEEQEFQRMAELRMEADQFATSSQMSSRNNSDRQKRSQSETVLSVRSRRSGKLGSRVKKAIKKTMNDVTVTSSRERLGSKRGGRPRPSPSS